MIPHISDKLEHGAILSSNWGFVGGKFAIVTRRNAINVWFRPMSVVDTPNAKDPQHGTHLPGSISGQKEERRRIWKSETYGEMVGMKRNESFGYSLWNGKPIYYYPD